MVICVIRYFLMLFCSNVPSVRFYFSFKYFCFLLFSLQRSFGCRKCARSRFEITAFAYFTIVWERLPHRCVCLLVCKWIQLTHTLLFHLRWYFLFSFCFYILIFPPIFPIFYSPFAMFSCSSYLHLVWMPFSSILIKE